MELPGGNYQYLIKKIDEFIRKYYLNKVIRGSIYLAATLFATYILVTLAEYYGNFDPLIRTVLFYTFLALNLGIFIRYILLPLSSYYKLGKTISHDQASLIIGEHFAHVKDKLLNTLQLHKLSDTNPGQRELIQASIDQKIVELKPIPFTKAVKVEENKKYLKYALAPFLVLILIAFTAPAIFSESTTRLIKHNQPFVKKAPFQFVILNKELSVVQGDDLELKVKLAGNEIPGDLYLEDGENLFKLDKENLVNFSYTFKNLQEKKQIRLLGAEYYSAPYTINVKLKPTLLNFDISLDYPGYTGRKDEIIHNTGDLVVPEGTVVSWKIRTKNTSNVDMIIGGKNFTINPQADNLFRFNYSARSNTKYAIKPRNSDVDKIEDISYQIQVIPDRKPSIEAEEKMDSIRSNVKYFIGNVSDDYGFSKLTFNYRLLDGQRHTKTISKSISFDKTNLQTTFMHTWDVNDAEVKPGQQIEYYFEISDNDVVNGFKSTRTSVKLYSNPSEKEIEKRIEESSAVVKQKLKQAIKQASAIEREAKNINQDLLNKKDLSYTEKKQVESLLQKNKKLEELVDEIRKANQRTQLSQQDLNRQEAILEKQKQIENLLNNVLDEKTRELLRNIEKLLGQNNKALTQQELSKMQMDNKNLQKEMDRILELYKQLEFDQKLTEAIQDLFKISEQQKDLSEQSLNKNVNIQQLREKQDQLKVEFKDLKESFKLLDEKNSLLEDKNDFQNPVQEQSQIEQQQEEISKNLNNKDLTRASGNQKKASQQMQNLAQKLQELQEQEEGAAIEVNLHSLNEILKNLLTLSFDQEKIMGSLRDITSNDPNYNLLTLKQKDIKDNLKMIQDSLYALSKRVPQIESVVNKEISAINVNIQKTLDNLGERKVAEANRNQQFAMTSLNNLALLLSEVQDQIQKAMKNAKQGGKGKQKSLSQLRKMQEQLSKNMEKARHQLQQQGKEQQNAGKGEMSKEFAEMVRQQQLIRQALQEINRDLNKDGQGKLGNLDKLAGQMEQIETDLVNKRIRQETLHRQQEILSRLLDAEKAEMERELDNKRESRKGLDQSPAYRVVLEEYKKTKQKELELLKTLPPTLNSFYKIKVEDYIKFLNSEK